jgi:hypothetical protein
MMQWFQDLSALRQALRLARENSGHYGRDLVVHLGTIITVVAN